MTELRALIDAALTKVPEQLASLNNLPLVISKAARENSISFEKLWALEKSAINKGLAVAAERIKKRIRISYLAAGKLAGKEVDARFLDQLLLDVDKYIKLTEREMKSRAREAFKNAEDWQKPEHLRKAIRKSINLLGARVRGSNSVAITSAYNQTLLQNAENFKYKTWKTMSNHPCEKCRKLNGAKISIEELFTVPSSIDKRKISAPPMHVHCACILKFS